MNFTQSQLPRFKDIVPADIQPTIAAILAKNQEEIAELLKQPQPFTWANLMQPQENMGDTLSKVWSPIGHMHATMETDSLRKAYNDALPVLTEYYTQISQNEALYQAIASIANGEEFATLSPAQQKIIQNDLRDFELAGIHLSAEKKARMAALQQELSQLTTKFSENILDATQGWIMHIVDEAKLEGLPQQAKELAMQNAKQRDLTGFVFTLDYPSYSTAIKFLRTRDLRKTLYEAYTTRASDVGPNAGRWDNTSVMEDILKTRHEIAALVGFNNYADYSLATKMAKTADTVLNFLHDLVKRSKPMAKKEVEEIAALAKKLDNLTSLEAWDLAYYSEKLQEETFNFTQEDLRPYFPLPKALSGLFHIIHQLYGITIKENKNIETWHPDAHFYEIYDEQNNLRGGFYTDLYARKHKRDGAWMDECRVRRRLDNGDLQLPVAYLTCNFMPPVNNQPALLTHDDVITLFHEFGHCLHHMITKVDYASVSGINGVAWDAVEFPSQFMENFCWQKESLAVIAGHYETGAPLPNDLYEKMLAAKHFQTGMQMIRQLEFSIFDFRLHLEYNPKKDKQVQAMLDEVRQETAVYPAPAFNRFQHSFSHIFAGGYAAGYYSYKWAEVLSSDAYEQFEEHGIFDRQTGKLFMENILEVGGVREPMQSFIAFRGREPKIDALLRLSGITA